MKFSQKLTIFIFVTILLSFSLFFKIVVTITFFYFFQKKQVSKVFQEIPKKYVQIFFCQERLENLKIEKSKKFYKIINIYLIILP